MSNCKKKKKKMASILLLSRMKINGQAKEGIQSQENYNLQITYLILSKFSKRKTVPRDGQLVSGPKGIKGFSCFMGLPISEMPFFWQ